MICDHVLNWLLSCFTVHYSNVQPITASHTIIKYKKNDIKNGKYIKMHKIWKKNTENQLIKILHCDTSRQYVLYVYV